MSTSASKFLACASCLSFVALAIPANAAKPTSSEALALAPLQKSEVDYDRPDADQARKCVVEVENRNGASGWTVRDENGRILRRFVDTNRDQRLDLWCYYKNGIEVYRDVDADFNGRADQYRWLGTAGMRWGVDKDENLKIDNWKMISAEEVTAEVVAALRERDSNRFRRLLLTENELRSLGMGDEQTKELNKRVAAAAERFAGIARQQNIVSPSSKWVYFSGSRPGVIPAGTDGATKDVVLYDNVTAVVETNGKHGQLVVGSLIRVGDVWRAVDVPQSIDDRQANAGGGLFFQVAARAPDLSSGPNVTGLSKEMQQLMADYETVEKAISTATTESKLAELNDQRALLLEKLMNASRTIEEHLNWARQFADIVSSAVQAGQYPAGMEKLKVVYKRLATEPDRRHAAAYVKYRFLNADYGISLQQSDADYGKIQEKWLATLSEFVKDYPKSDVAPNALMELALAQEFAGKTTDANAFYGQIVRDFPTSPFSKKAAGAQARINSVGKTIPLRGKSVAGEQVDLAAYRGKTVLIHYWATYCDSCKQEFTLLKQLKGKYGSKGFALIGVSLDVERNLLDNYLKSNPLPWAQLYEEGGMDSRLAIELGISTIPMMILVDKYGKVVRRNLHASEIEMELKKLLR